MCSFRPIAHPPRPVQAGPVNNDLCVFRHMQAGPVDSDLCVFRPMQAGPVDNDLCVFRPMQAGPVDNDLCVFRSVWTGPVDSDVYVCVFSDPLHTYLGLCGLALMGEPGLATVHPALNISQRAADHLFNIHKKWES